MSSISFQYILKQGTMQEDNKVQYIVVVHDFGFFLPSVFLSVLTNIIFSNSDFLSGIAK